LKYKKTFTLKGKDNRRRKAITVIKALLRATDCSHIGGCLLQDQVPEGPHNLVTPPVISSDAHYNFRDKPTKTFSNPSTSQ